jgi:protein TonB
MQSLRPVLASLALSTLIAAAHGQASPPAAAASAAHDPALVERAQKEGDKVFKWIILADKPRKAEAKAPPPAAPAPAPAPRAVARVKDEGITERVTPIQPAAAATASAKAPAPAPAAVAVTSPAAAASSAAPAEPASQLALAPATTAAVKAPPPPEPEEEEDLPLELVKQVNPEFPATVMQRLEKGSVRVRFEVQADGSVKGTEVLRTSSNRLNEPAQRAIGQWQFKPLKHVQYGIVELAFNINE